MTSANHTCPDCGHHWFGPTDGDPRCLACRFTLDEHGDYVQVPVLFTTSDDQPQPQA